MTSIQWRNPLARIWAPTMRTQWNSPPSMLEGTCPVGWPIGQLEMTTAELLWTISTFNLDSMWRSIHQAHWFLLSAARAIGATEIGPMPFRVTTTLLDVAPVAEVAQWQEPTKICTSQGTLLRSQQWGRRNLQLTCQIINQNHHGHP